MTPVSGKEVKKTGPSEERKWPDTRSEIIVPSQRQKPELLLVGWRRPGTRTATAHKKHHDSRRNFIALMAGLREAFRRAAPLFYGLP